jgi:hypothetical protein
MQNFIDRKCSYPIKNTIQFWIMKPVEELSKAYCFPVQRFGL